VGAVSIPLHTQSPGGPLVLVPTFVDDVQARFPAASTEGILLGCRSGRRSMTAAEMLAAAGYKGLRNVAGGFLDWEKEGLASSKM